LTILGRGFDILREVRAVRGSAVLGGRCHLHFGGPSGVRVPGTALDEVNVLRCVIAGSFCCYVISFKYFNSNFLFGP